MDLRNPFIMPPLKLGYSQGDGRVNERHLEFYTPRAEHLGAITLEPLYLDPRLREIPTQLGIDADDKLPGLSRLVDAIHDKGAKVIAHLNHPGRMANPLLPGNIYLSATDQACPNGGATPTPMDTQGMETVIEQFVLAGRRAAAAHFDLIELQMGHGYLLAQFLSPEVNDREDAYGGPLENRMRFPLQVLDALRSAVDLPIIVRLSGEEMTPAGIKLPETLELCHILEQHGAHALHISAGSACTTPPWFFQHMFVPHGKTWEFAARVQETVDLPVIFVGQINSTTDIKRLRDEFNARWMAVGRALVADPDFVKKVLDGREMEIRPCLACSDGCLGGVKSGRGLHCVMNPTVGEDMKPASPIETPRKVAVVGAGLAGMTAAIELHRRGFSVEIFEKERPGGQFNLASLPPGKAGLARAVEYLLNEVQRCDIPIHAREATAEELLEKPYDEVVIATGAAPIVPPIPGLTDYVLADHMEIDPMPTNKRILIIGGGLVGLEVASRLVEGDNQLFIVDLLPELAKDMELIERTLTLKKLNAHDVRFYLETRVEGIENGRITLKGEQAGTLDDMDLVVVATGMRSENHLHEALKDRIVCHLIGDARQVGKAETAIRDAYLIAQRM